MRDCIISIVKGRAKGGTNANEHQHLLLDMIAEIAKSEEEQFDLALTYLIGGFHTTGNCK